MDLIPWYWKAGAAALLFAGVVLGEQAYEHHLIAKGDTAGYARAHGEWVTSETKVKADAEQHLADENAAHRAETEALQDKFNQMADDRQKDKAHHEDDKNRAVADALARVERLSIPTDGAGNGALPPAGDGQSAQAGPGSAPAPRADLLPETAAAILDIAADYGQIVRDYNDIVDRYERAEAACNAEPVKRAGPGLKP